MNSKARILIVDDELEILASLRRTLRSCGFDLTCIGDPQHAIDLLERETFDLLLSDIDMPGLDGHAVMARARALAPKMIRMFLTANGSTAAAVRAINEGEVHRFIPKPFDADDLRRQLREALERKSEIDIVSEASSRASQRRQLYAQLEAEHPGITETGTGIYVVGITSLAQMSEVMGSNGLGKGDVILDFPATRS